MTKRVVSAAVTFGVFLFLALARTEEEPKQLGNPREMVIQPLGTSVRVESDEKKCGEYFILTPRGEVPGTSVFYLFDLDTPKGKRRLAGAYSVGTVRVKIDPSKRRGPTAEILFSGGLPKTVILIRISREDYEKAADCLPRPEASPPERPNRKNADRTAYARRSFFIDCSAPRRDRWQVLHLFRPFSTGECGTIKAEACQRRASWQKCCSTSSRTCVAPLPATTKMSCLPMRTLFGTRSAISTALSGWSSAVR